MLHEEQMQALIWEMIGIAGRFGHAKWKRATRTKSNLLCRPLSAAQRERYISKRASRRCLEELSVLERDMSFCEIIFLRRDA